MNILFIGDIVGKSGREAVLAQLAGIKLRNHIDLTIANGENSAHGKGITKKIYDSFIAAGIDAVTMGNHTFSNDGILKFIADANRLVRPMNRDPEKPGKGALVLPWNGLRIGIYNLSGETFMDGVTLSPFREMERLLAEYPADIHITDLHAEATSEKAAFLHYFYGRLEAVVGTHTHVQTADECIYQGCAFISDVGMCGAYDSVIGRDTGEILARLIRSEKTHFVPADSPAMICAAVITIDEQSRRATAIRRIQIRP